MFRSTLLHSPSQSDRSVEQGLVGEGALLHIELILEGVILHPEEEALLPVEPVHHSAALELQVQGVSQEDSARDVLDLHEKWEVTSSWYHFQIFHR